MQVVEHAAESRFAGEAAEVVHHEPLVESCGERWYRSHGQISAHGSRANSATGHARLAAMRGSATRPRR